HELNYSSYSLKNIDGYDDVDAIPDVSMAKMIQVWFIRHLLAALEQAGPNGFVEFRNYFESTKNYIEEYFLEIDGVSKNSINVPGWKRAVYKDGFYTFEQII